MLFGLEKKKTRRSRIHNTDINYFNLLIKYLDYFTRIEVHSR